MSVVMGKRRDRRHASMRKAAALAVLGISVVACRGKDEPTPPAEASAREIALAGAKVMIAVGDIAMCGKTGDEQTAALIDSVLRADSIAGVPNVVVAIGDNVYPVGSARDFESCFTPSWGDRNKRIMKFIRPTPGNHDYNTRDAEPYFEYFGERAGPGKRGYYSYDIGDWHVV